MPTTKSVKNIFAKPFPYRRIGLGLLSFLFVSANFIAAFHAYKFTHFTREELPKPKDPKLLTVEEKMEKLVFGVDLPRPELKGLPTQHYETVQLKTNGIIIECWSIKAAQSKGTVVIFHGYGAEKSAMLDKSDAFLAMGFSTFLVDFRGSGGSEGVQTTIGYKEAEEVYASYMYLTKQGNQPIYLYGTSMGAAAVLKALRDYPRMLPKGAILECPFGTMYQTTCARFRTMGVPSFPMASFLLFWGGTLNGFWGFGHNPAEYAKSVDTPILLLYGEQDEKVSREEIDAIRHHLKGPNQLVLFANAGHENYFLKYKSEWLEQVRSFLK